MTISLRAAGTAVSGTTTCNPSVPAGTTTGDVSVLTVSMKPYSATITTPSGWTKITEVTDGTVAAGTNTGSMKVAMFVRESAPVAALGNLTVSGASSVGAVINSYQKSVPGSTWDYSTFTTGTDSAVGANYSAAGAVTLATVYFDWVIAGSAINSSAGTPSAMAINLGTGSGIGTNNTRPSLAIATTNTSRLLVVDGAVNSGNLQGTAAPGFVYTNASSTSGSTIFLRLRELDYTEHDWTGIGLSPGTGLTSGNTNTAGNGDFMQLGVSGTTTQVMASPLGAGVEMNGATGSSITRLDGGRTPGRWGRSQVVYTPHEVPASANIGLLDVHQATGNGYTVVQDSAGKASAYSLGAFQSGSTAPVALVNDHDYLVDQMWEVGTTTSNSRLIYRVTDLTDPTWNTTGVFMWDSGYTRNFGTIDTVTHRFGKQGGPAGTLGQRYALLRWQALTGLDSSLDPVVTAAQFFDNPFRSGVATGAVQWDGSAAGSGAPDVGTAAGTVQWDGTAVGAMPVGPAQGTVTGAVTWAGTATGSGTPDVGAASGAVAWVGSAVGSGVPNQGSTAGAVTWAGAAAGQRSPVGTSAGAVGWAGVAAGSGVANVGASIGSVAWAGSAAGTTSRTGTAAGAVGFAGVVAGASSPVGASSGSVTWAGSATGVAPANTGAVTGAVTWAGAAAGARSSDGTSTGGITWAGSAAGSRTPQAASSGTVSWAGSAAGSHTSAASSAGSVTWVGSAAGVEQPVGTSSGAVTWVGAAAGVAPAEDAKAGTSSGTVSWAGSVTGSRPAGGAVSGTVTWAGAAAGAVGHAGTAPGTVSWAGSAAGARLPVGAAAGGVTWSGAAVGDRASLGSAAGAVEFDGSATGETLTSGAATGAVGWSGAASGQFLPTGSVVGMVLWSGSAVGFRFAKGSAQGSVTWAGAAEGHAGGSGLYLTPIVVGPPRTGLSVGRPSVRPVIVGEPGQPIIVDGPQHEQPEVGAPGRRLRLGAPVTSGRG